MSAQPGAEPVGSGSDGSVTTRLRPPTGRTAWARNLGAPVRSFLNTEAGGAAVLLCSAAAALVWANAFPGSYESVWTAKLSIRLGSEGITEDLRQWANEGLMTFFFLVIGLEAKRELDLGQLRERRRVTLPLTAAVAGMALPVLIYLGFNPGARTRGSAGSSVCHLGERAAPVQAASLDQLRDRASVRPGEHGHRLGRAVDRRCRHLTRDPRDPVRLRRRQAARDPRRSLARVTSERGAPRAELADDRGCRSARRHRFHSFDLDL